MCFSAHSLISRKNMVGLCMMHDHEELYLQPCSSVNKTYTVVINNTLLFLSIKYI